MIFENNTEAHTPPYENRSPVRVGCMTQGTQSPSSVTTSRDGVGGRGLPEGGDTWMPVADSCCCMAEAIPVL